MASLCGISFAVLNESAPVAPQGMMLDRVERAGADGLDYIERGTRPGVGVVRVMQGYSSASARDSALATWMAIKGTRGSFVPTEGTTRTVVVMDVRPGRKMKVAAQSGLGGLWVLEGEFEVEVTE